MSTFTLKLIAIIAMLIDHVGAIFIPPDTVLYVIMRAIGRLAFPIFIFLIVEGFYHTSNVKKYLMRLGIFALISEIPFDLAFYHEQFQSDIHNDLKNIFHLLFTAQDYSEQLSILLNRFFFHQNVFFTLFLGLLLIILMKKVELKFNKSYLLSNLLEALLTIGFCILAFMLRTDYSYAGILLIAAFYLFRGNKFILSLSVLLISASLLYRGNNLFTTIMTVATTLSMVLIAVYNGKKGKNVKYLFYIFYPAHLLILYFISSII